MWELVEVRPILISYILLGLICNNAPYFVSSSCFVCKISFFKVTSDYN